VKYPGDPLDEEAVALIAALPENLREPMRQLATVLCTQGLIEERTARRRQTTYRLRFRERDQASGVMVQRSLSLGAEASVASGVRALLDHWRRQKPRMCGGEPMWPLRDAKRLVDDPAKMARMYASTLAGVSGRGRVRAARDFRAAYAADKILDVLAMSFGGSDAKYRSQCRPGRPHQCRLW
jgi:hypothetical protein